MFTEIFPKQLNREIDDFQNLDDFLNTDIALEEEFSYDLQNLISHSINGIQPAVRTGLASATLTTPKQTPKGHAQSCQSPGILFINGTGGAIDHSELKPSITELHPRWFTQPNTIPSYMTTIGSATHPIQEPINVKVENFGQRSPCQTVPRASFSNVPSPVTSIGPYSTSSALSFESEPNSPRSRHGSFSSLPTTVVNADNKVFLEIPRQKPGRKPSGKANSNSRKRAVEKGTKEYVTKRCRNNVAVRKSREKAKLKQVNTEGRVEDLSQDNKALQKKVELLQKELSILRSLFVNVGASLPANIDELLKN